LRWLDTALVKNREAIRAAIQYQLVSMRLKNSLLDGETMVFVPTAKFGQSD